MCVRPSITFYGYFSLATDRSPGFGLSACDLTALLRLALASAPDLKSLTSPHTKARRTVLQKVRGRALSSPPTVCKHGVSGSLSLPSRGPFHLSLTVLFLYRSPGSVQPWGVVPPPSLRVSRVPSYSGFRLPRFRLRLRGFHPLRPDFPFRSAVFRVDFRRSCTPECSHSGLGFSDFARRYSRYHFCFLFLRLLRCFSSSGSLRMTMDSSYGV